MTNKEFKKTIAAIMAAIGQITTLSPEKQVRYLQKVSDQLSGLIREMNVASKEAKQLFSRRKRVVIEILKQVECMKAHAYLLGKELSKKAAKEKAAKHINMHLNKMYGDVKHSTEDKAASVAKKTADSVINIIKMLGCRSIAVFFSLIIELDKSIQGMKNAVLGLKHGVVNPSVFSSLMKKIHYGNFLLSNSRELLKQELEKTNE